MGGRPILRETPQVTHHLVCRHHVGEIYVEEDSRLQRVVETVGGPTVLLDLWIPHGPMLKLPYHVLLAAQAAYDPEWYRQTQVHQRKVVFATGNRKKKIYRPPGLI